MNNQPPAYFVDGILAGNIAILSRAITLVESLQPAHRELASGIIDGVLQHSGRSFRLGITGVPGVGKSTFIESFGMELLRRGHKLAVLAVDPSSSKSKGSILGDKTRMEKLSVAGNVFIRPSPSAGAMGGVARASYETILLCEAAGYDFIIVETVGVGQSETAVSRITDFFLLLMLAGAGDELQGIKRGIMEMADGLVITKADGDNIHRAKSARAEYAHAMHLLQAPESGWTPRVLTCSALTGTGMSEIAEMLESFRNKVQQSGFLSQHRTEQQFAIFKDLLEAGILRKYYDNKKLIQKIGELRTRGLMNPFREAAGILDSL